MLTSQSMAMYGELSPMAESSHSMGQPRQNLQEERERMRERVSRRAGEREKKEEQTEGECVVVTSCSHVPGTHCTRESILPYQ